MKLKKSVTTSLLLAGLFVGSLGAGLAFTSNPFTAAAAPAAQTQPVDAPTTEDDDDVQEPSYNGSIAVDESQTEGLSEADEAAALQGQASITADEAQAAAEAASGATATKVELDNENGFLVYSVELDNGQDVKVDAGNGAVLHTEQAGADDENEADEADENEADEADEADEVPPADLAVSIEEAQAIAAAANPDATVLSIEYEAEGGLQMYEAELDSGADVYIDANSGEILTEAVVDAD